MKMIAKVKHLRKRIRCMRHMKYRLDHHHSYSAGGILYVKSWVALAKHIGTGVSGIFCTKYPYYSNLIYVYIATWWPNPKMGPPTKYSY